MPPSALEQLTRLNIIYPMLFKLTNKKTNRITHCGVLEFIADEGKVYLPYWVSICKKYKFYFSCNKTIIKLLIKASFAIFCLNFIHKGQISTIFSLRI